MSQAGNALGTLIVHRGLTNYLSWSIKSYPAASGRGSPVNSSIAFDATITSIFTPLLVGKKVILLPEEEEIEALGELLASGQELSLVKITPAHLEILNQLWPTTNQQGYQAQAFIVGGEALLKRHVAFLQHHPSPIRVVNEYGPTETVVGCCVYDVPQHEPLRASPSWRDAIPIGRPIANTQLYILDPHLQPVPIGVPGELHIGGAGVARGYKGRPELTAQKFIPNPFGPGRLYKTGDLCRYLPESCGAGSGNIEYLGRTDYQVKIRGYRIELGEIEAALNSLLVVREAVVVAHQEASHKRLVAYVIFDMGQELESMSESELASVLRKELSQKLPDYMIPAVFVSLESMPLTPNGKIDRRGLPAPEIKIDSAQLVLPSTPVETMLAAIWQEVLGLEQVGITDNFFELGGDSIISIQIVSRAKEAGINITPRDLFQHQTIAELASVATDVQNTDAEQGTVTGELPLTPIQHWFLEQKWRESHHFNQSVFLELSQEVNPTWLAEALAALLTHHDALRLRFERRGDSWQQVIVSPSAEVPFEVIDLSRYSPEEQVARQEAKANQLQASLDLSQGPLLRVALFRGNRASRSAVRTGLSQQVNRLLIVIHHLAVDGVSWRILLEDLQRTYLQLASGEAIKLPTKSTSFREWATLLNEQGPSLLQAELPYWEEVATYQPPLPVDYGLHPHGELGPNNNTSAVTISTQLDSKQTSALLSEVPAVYHTQINDLLLTALLLACKEWTDDSTLLLNLEGHGREELFEVDLSRTVGWFTTIFPVRLEIPPHTSLGEAIKSVKEQLRRLPNRGIGYGILRYLDPEGMRTPLEIPEVEAQISFNYLGQARPPATGTLINGFAKQSSGSAYSPFGSRPHLLDINGMVIEGTLQLNWTYSRNFHRAATIKKLADRVIDALVALIAHCQEPEAGGYTPSDFPEADLNQDELDDLLSGKKAGIEAIYPLSPMQQGMLFHSLYAPQSGVYFVQTPIMIKGNLDTRAFKEAWQQMVARHAVLRTLFVWEQRQTPLQVVRQEVQLPWTEQDWRGDKKPEEQLELYLAREREQGVELDSAPLIRCALMRIADEGYYFVCNFHHLLLDGWSIPLLQQELWTTYQAVSLGKRVALPHPRPYKDYIAWLQRQDMAQAEAYWRQTLKGFTTPTPLAVDRARVSTDTYLEYKLYLSEESSANLQKMAKRNRLTINTIIQGAWALLLSRYNCDSDVLFGATVSGRPAELSGIETMVGMFINTLPVRVNVPADMSLLAWLQDLQQKQQEREQYAYTPLVDIQGWSEVPPGTSLFESLLVYENYPVDKESQIGRNLQITGLGSMEQTNYPLTLTAFMIQSNLPQLFLEFSYDTSRFEQDTIRRMSEHLQTLLASIAANPLKPLAEHSILSESEKHRLLVEWNDTATDYGHACPPYSFHHCINSLFEKQAERTPNACALVFGDRQLTYRELNARANQVAHYLIRQGVGPDVLVGICIERSIDMVIGLLGTLKAGGAYLPLDPAYPKERFAYMLSDGKVQILLTQQSLLDSDLLPINKQGLSSVCLDTEWQIISQQSSANPISGATPDNLAYVIYTSGSTGMPKGVAIHHRNLVNAYLAWEEAYQLRTTASSHLQMASFSFDVFSGDLVRALCSGGKLVLCPREWLLAPEKLYQLMLSQAVDTAEFVPAVIKHLVEYLKESKQDLAFMRLLIVGSDSWYMKEYRDLQQFCGPRTRLINSYGVTEATIDSSYFEKSQINLADERPVPIGRPFGNMQLYILDHHLQPVPVGVPGQLHIGGAGLARGYLNRPKLTAEKFIHNPFALRTPAYGSRLYKTGDLCRYLPDTQGAGSGNTSCPSGIEFLGRTDYQVKIRGFRIELGEIEAVLNSQVGVHKAVVMVHEMAIGKRLVAYLVGKIPSRNQLISALPDYMIPNAFVQLEAMPLTPNGKIDRRALPAPEHQIDSTELVLPRTPVEAILAGIWQEVLDQKLVGIHDNFFELGGHSLLATQVVSRIRQQLKVELPLRYLFSAPTIVELAKELNRTESSLPPLEPLDQQARAQHLPLSFAQQRLWFLAQLDGMSDAYNMPTALRLDGPLDVAAFSASWQVISERHEALRTTFPIVDGQAYQQINSPNFKLELIDLSHKSSEQQEADVAELSHQSATYVFDLSNGPLWRVSLLRLSENSHVVLLCMHHIISDGWSIGVLIAEFSALYSQKKSTQGVTTSQPLPQLPIQYADFAVWQRSWLQGELLKEQLHYWKAQLANAPALLTLPTDYPRPAIQSYRGHEISFALPKALHTELVSLSAQNSMTLFMTLQAAFAVLLWRYSGEEDILIGTPIANRQVAEVENLIGFFVNTLVLRNDLSGNPSFDDFLSRVRQVALDAYQHQALPFELLVETVQPERSLSHSPLFQVMFTLDNNRQEALTFPELTISPIEVEYPIAKFDLTLTMEEYEEGLIGSWEYNTDLFERATIERMAGHFQTLLEGIVANPDQAIGKLPLLSESEKQKLLVEWNDTGMPVGSMSLPPHGAPSCRQACQWVADSTSRPANLIPAHSTSDKCIHHLFEQQAQHTPDAVALIAGDKQLTYQQLNARSNQLAHMLVKQGVGPDVLVGICVERSIEMVVGLLGILKAGAAYVPLDPAYPKERQKFILSDSGVRLLLTESQLMDEDMGLEVLCLDQDWQLIAQEDDSNPQTGVKLNHLAYCIYTSGSTGQPKGVLIEHRNLLNFVLSAQSEYEVTQQDRILQFASISFDTAVEEIYPILLSGGTLILRTDEMLSMPAFWQSCRDLKLTVLDLPTAYWHQLASQLAEYSPLPEALRLVIIGGERAIPEQLKIWQQHVGQKPKLLNTYGPTEATVVATSYNLSDYRVIAGRELPIGRPLSNVQVYILDQFLQPVPIGVPGQLHIGGAGLARGYLNRPQLTGEKFIQNPFALGRLYKTGDLSRYLPDGNIEFLGRTDYQVKIRGFRIELGEIETALNSQVGVDEAVVVLYEKAASSGSDKQLVAYVVGEVPSKAQLRETLPDYMIPSAFVRLETIPLTPNGKVDRRALTQGLESSDLLSSALFIAPRNQTEQQLTHIWQEVLGLHSVGVRDSFFDLGGHSLLAVRLMAKIQANFGMNLPLSTLFQSPTIEQLAIQLVKPSATADWSALVPIQPNGDKRPFFCVPGAGGNVIYFYDLARLIGSDQPFYGLQAIGLSGEKDPYTTVEAMAAHYIKAIQSVQPEGPYFLGGHSFGSWVAYEMAQQLMRAGHEVARVIILDTSAPVPHTELDTPHSHNDANWDDAKWLVSAAEAISRWAGTDTRLSDEDIQLLEPDEQLIRFKEELERLDVLPAKSDLKQARGWVQVYKTNNLIHYTPHSVIPTPITLFQAKEEEQQQDSTWGWNQFAKGTTTVVSVPGDHLTMMKRPHIKVLAERLRECLHRI